LTYTSIKNFYSITYDKNILIFIHINTNKITLIRFHKNICHILNYIKYKYHNHKNNIILKVKMEMNMEPFVLYIIMKMDIFFKNSHI